MANFTLIRKSLMMNTEGPTEEFCFVLQWAFLGKRRVLPETPSVGFRTSWKQNLLRHSELAVLLYWIRLNSSGDGELYFQIAEGTPWAKFYSFQIQSLLQWQELVKIPMNFHMLLPTHPSLSAGWGDPQPQGPLLQDLWGPLWWMHLVS